MSSLDADLAALRNLSYLWPEVDRVEAEISRLRRERGDLDAAYFSVNAKREAAEREVARLQEGLRHIERMAGAAGTGEMPAKPIADEARALLAEDTPEDGTA